MAMSNHRENPIPGLLYKLFVYGFGTLCVIYLVAPIVIAVMMSFTSGQTLKYPPQGFSLRWYEALLDPVRSATEHIAAWNSFKIAALAVLGVYVRSDAVNLENLHIDQQLMDAVGRMGGHTYTRTRDQFDIKTLTPDEWEARERHD